MRRARGALRDEDAWLSSATAWPAIGVRRADLRYAPAVRHHDFGDETHVNYNRILLSSVLAGEKTADEITLNPLEWYRRNEIHLRLGVRVVDVDAERQDRDGRRRQRDAVRHAAARDGQLGVDAADQGSTRTASSRSARSTTRATLLERAGPGVKAVVIGGGLLGLEAARGLQVQGCHVTVVHLMSTLMERQLDPDGGNYLTGKMEELGVRVLLGKSTTAIVGDERAEGVAFEDGEILERRPRRRRRRHPSERRARPTRPA